MEVASLSGEISRPPRDQVGAPLALLLPTVAMSLGWGLRGTIGGGQIGATIPGAIVMFCLCHLLGWKRSLGTVAAIGTVGVALGGQETYGQTIGFLRNPETVAWGLAGLTIKGAMWGLSGGLLVGLAFMHARYRRLEIAVGLGLMVLGTVLGRTFIDEPKLAYFSNRLDKPREEIWAGLTLGTALLWGSLVALRREGVSSAFAAGGAIAGAIGFGGGSLFLALGFSLNDPYRGWPWWKMMEFTFGALYGLGMGAVCVLTRRSLLAEHHSIEAKDHHTDPLDHLPTSAVVLLGWIVSLGSLGLNFTLPYRASFTLIAPGLILLSLWSNRLAWHVPLGLTMTGFLRDFLRGGVERQWFEPGCDGWLIVGLIAIPVVLAVAQSERKARLTPATALLGLAWFATLFGLMRVGIPRDGKDLHLFVPAVFVVELLATTLLVRVQPRSTGLDRLARS